jgi:geranylgeranyl reductase family protein
LQQNKCLSIPIETDVLIIGAGPAGSSAALFLANQGISCTIVDKENFPRDKICGDALSGKVVEVLNKLNPEYAQELNLHQKFLDSWGVTFVAPSGEALRVPFKSGHVETKNPPGFISKRIDFDNWLIEKMKQNPVIHFFENTEIRNYTRHANGITAVSKQGQNFAAKLVIACDGAYSSFTKNIAAIKTEPGHNCFGLRAYFKNVKGLDARNFIELHFLKEILPGYFWIFPLANGEANVGIGMRADKMSRNKVNLKKKFEEILQKNKTIHARFETAEQIGDIKLYGLPLGSKKRQLSGDNYMLCGDAAQLIDPFTGEGIGNAMLSGMLAARQAAFSLSNQNFSGVFMQQYDDILYERLWNELLLSYRLQQLVNFPSIFNLVVRKANSNQLLRETISGMFEDLDARANLKKPAFYLKLLFS